MKYKGLVVFLLLSLSCSPSKTGDRSEAAETKPTTLPEWFSNGKFGTPF